MSEQKAAKDVFRDTTGGEIEERKNVSGSAGSSDRLVLPYCPFHWNESERI